ncbi:MAG: hypothetical protein AB8I08_29820 [Sandaracinaceae bacterium]
MLTSFKLRRHEEHVWIMRAGAETGVTLRGAAARRAFELGAALFRMACPDAPERVRALSVDLGRARLIATIDEGAAKPTPVRHDGPDVLAALPQALLDYLLTPPLDDLATPPLDGGPSSREARAVTLDNALAALDGALAALADSPLAVLAEHVRFEPVDAAAYQRAFVQLGRKPPADLLRFVETRGLLRVPDLGTPFDLPAGNSGFRMLGPEGLFAAYQHLDDTIDAGSEAARELTLIASVGTAPFGPGYAIGPDGIGLYHPDRFVAGDARGVLQGSVPSFSALLSAFASGLETAVRRGDRVAMMRVAKSLSRAPSAPFDPAKEWTRFERADRVWDADVATRLGPVLAHTKDPAVVTAIVKRIQADLDGRGIVDPYLAGVFQRGAWPAGYPGVNELLQRLPAEGAGGLRGIARWCLGWSALPLDASLEAAARALASRVDDGSDDAAAWAATEPLVSLAGTARGVATVETARAFLSRAYVFALGPMSPARVRHIAVIVLQLARLARTAEGAAAGLEASRTAQPFGLPALFEKLVATQAGDLDSVPGRLQPLVDRPRDAPVTDALVAWFDTHTGSQREKLAALEAEWTERVRAASEEDRAWALRRVKKQVNSKKLRAARDAWLAGLG